MSVTLLNPLGAAQSGGRASKTASPPSRQKAPPRTLRGGGHFHPSYWRRFGKAVVVAKASRFFGGRGSGEIGVRAATSALMRVVCRNQSLSSSHLAYRFQRRLAKEHLWRAAALSGATLVHPQPLPSKITAFLQAPLIFRYDAYNAIGCAFPPASAVGGRKVKFHVYRSVEKWGTSRLRPECA